jgi:hypothetical protein
VAVTVHVPHNRSLAREVTRTDDCLRVTPSQDVLELGDRLAFSERSHGVIAEGDVIGRVDDQSWPLALSHRRYRIARTRDRGVKGPVVAKA